MLRKWIDFHKQIIGHWHYLTSILFNMGLPQTLASSENQIQISSSLLLPQQRLRYLDPCTWTVQRWWNCCQRACLWNGNHQVSFLVLRSNFNSFYTLQCRISSKLIPNWVWLVSLSLLGWMATIFWLCIMPQRRLANWQYLRTGLCWLRPWPTGLTSKHLKSRSKLRVRQVFSECMNSFVGRKID